MKNPRELTPDLAGNKRFSYNHYLTPRQRSIYKLVLQDQGNKIIVSLVKSRETIGKVWAYHCDKAVGEASGWEPHGSVQWKYQNRGFGKILYQVLIDHLKNYLGYKWLTGMRHTSAAHRVHKALRRDLGIKYNCRRLTKPENIAGFNCTYSRYVVKID